MKLKVFSLAELKETKGICQTYQELTSEKDVFYDLEYLSVNALHEEGDTFIALLLNEQEIMVSYAFVKRTFNYLNYKFDDIITPYEYGGVVLHVSDINMLITFEDAFREYCNENNILTDFQRINPFENKIVEHYPVDINIEEINNNIIVDLNQSEETIFSNYHKNNRRDIRYAVRNGVIIEEHKPSEQSISLFYNLYKKTMDIKDASKFYYFNFEYFEALKSFSSEKLSVFIAKSIEGESISAALILKNGVFSHYHLSGTDRNLAKLCGTNLLLHQVIINMKKEGKKYFHLGGAAKTQQGLYSFKKKFSQKTIPYYVVKRIFNNYLYNEINLKMIKSNSLDQAMVDSNFFPLYRKLKQLSK